MKIFKRRRRRGQSGRARFGTAAVEFALTAPALLAVIICTFEFARISMMRNIAHNAAYEAARASIVEGATLAEGVREANGILARVGTHGARVTINEGTDFDFDTGEINVRVEIPMEDNAFFFPLFYQDRQIVAEVSMRTERYNGFFDASLDSNGN